MENNCAILIADIKSSRVYSEEERFSIQERLKKIVSILNFVFEESLVYSLDFSAGDSIQGLFKNPESSLRCYFVLQNLFLPNLIRGGIGYDEVNKYLASAKDYKDTNEIDGSAYHLARKAIDFAKTKDIDVIFFSRNSSSDIFLNNFLISSSNSKRQLSPEQRILFRLSCFLNPILSRDEILRYENKLSEMLSFFEFDSNKYMYPEKLQNELINIFNINKTDFEFYQNNYSLNHVFSTDLVSRSSDGYLAKFYNVTPQNISSLRRRGKMNAIRTLDIISAIYLWKEHIND